jgi:cyclophilin family peptidyl-prolyl cis-trans isomerase
MFNWIRRRQPATRVRPKCRLSLESLEDRQLLSTVPVMGAITDQTLPNGGPLFVPVISSDGDNSLVGYTVTSSDPNVTVVPRQGFGYLDIKVKGYGPNNDQSGDMIFQLYSDISPVSVAIISTLVQQGFYTNLTFHRIVPGFVIQGGDPLGNGSGGPGFGFPTETGPLSQFNGTGQLSLANAEPGTPNSNGSQFFVTIGAQQSSPIGSGNFTLLGQLVRGFDVENQIALTPISDPTNGTPVKKPVIVSATIIPDYTDTVLQIVTPAGYNADAKITVTATSSAGRSTQSFHLLVGNGGIDLQRIQFVNRAFSTILGRPAEQSAVDYFTGLLANNQTTTGQIALQIQTSLEARMNEVNTVYKALLKRSADPQALAANTIFLMQGGSVAQMEANITASQEFFEAQGGTNVAWINAMFKAANGAASVPIGYANQVSTMLDQGLKRTTYATTIFNDISSDVFTVQNLYVTFLERTPPPSVQEVMPFAQQLASGASEDVIVSAIVGSNEFFNFTQKQNAGP